MKTKRRREERESLNTLFVKCFTTNNVKFTYDNKDTDNKSHRKIKAFFYRLNFDLLDIKCPH